MGFQEIIELLKQGWCELPGNEMIAIIVNHGEIKVKDDQISFRLMP